AADRVHVLQLLARLGQLPRRARRGFTVGAPRAVHASLQLFKAALQLALLLRHALRLFERQAVLRLAGIVRQGGRRLAAGGRAQVALGLALLLGQLPRTIS